MSLIYNSTGTIKDFEDSHTAGKSQDLSFESGEETADLSFYMDALMSLSTNMQGLILYTDELEVSTKTFMRQSQENDQNKRILEDKLMKQEKEIIQFTHRIQSLENDLQRKNESLKESAVAKSEMERVLEFLLNSKAENFDTRIIEKDDTIKHLEVANAKKQSIIDDLEKELNFAHEDLKRKSVVETINESKLEALQQELILKENLLEAQKRQFQIFEHQIRGKLDQVYSEVYTAQLENELINLKDQQKRQEIKILEMETESTAAAQQYRDHLASLEFKISDMQAQEKNYSLIIESLQERLDADKAEAKNVELTAAVQTLKTELQKSLDSQSRLTIEKEGLIKDQEVQSAELSSLKLKFKKLFNESQVTSKRLAEMEQQEIGHVSKLKTIGNTLEGLKNENEALQKRLDTSRLNYEKELLVLEKTAKQANDQLSQEKISNTNLKESLIALSKEFQAVKAQWSAEKKELPTQEMVKSMQDKITFQAKQIATHETVKQNLEDTIKSLERRVESLITANQKLKERDRDANDLLIKEVSNTSSNTTEKRSSLFYKK